MSLRKGQRVQYKEAVRGSFPPHCRGILTFVKYEGVMDACTVENEKGSQWYEYAFLFDVVNDVDEGQPVGKP